MTSAWRSTRGHRYGGKARIDPLGDYTKIGGSFYILRSWPLSDFKEQCLKVIHLTGTPTAPGQGGSRLLDVAGWNSVGR